MFADIARMSFHAQLSLYRIRCLDGFEIGVERRFDVDHEFALVRHAHDHVGTGNLVFSYRVDLFLEVTVFDHACQFDESPQRDLAPAAADFGPAQCFDEILRFLREHLLACAHRFELFPDAAVGLPLELKRVQPDRLVGIQVQ